MRPPTLKSSLKHADDSWREAGFRRWGKKCINCGKEAILGHHYIAKSLCDRLRFDTSNHVPMCWHCHQVLHAQADPLIIDRINTIRGIDWKKDLEDKRASYIQENKSSYKSIKYYQEKQRELDLSYRNWEGF